MNGRPNNKLMPTSGTIYQSRRRVARTIMEFPFRKVGSSLYTSKKNRSRIYPSLLRTIINLFPSILFVVASFVCVCVYRGIVSSPAPVDFNFVWICKGEFHFVSYMSAAAPIRGMKWRFDIISGLSIFSPRFLSRRSRARRP